MGMEFVGRRVRKEFQGRGTFFGSVQTYLPATGFFKIIYDDGVSEELNLFELSPLLVFPEPPSPPLPHLPELAAGRPEIELEKRRRITVEGKVDKNLVVGCGIPGRTSRNPIELDLNSDKVIDLNNDGDHGRNLGKLHGFDLNGGLDLNEGIMEEVPGEKRENFDLSLDADEDVENVSSERKVGWFDLNVELKEDEVSDLNDHDGKTGENGRFSTDGDKKMGKEPVIADAEKGILVSNMENKEESHLGKCGNGVNYEKAASESVYKKSGRKGKAVLDIIESDAAKTVKVDTRTGSLNSELEKRKETLSEKARDSIDYVDGASGSAERGRRRRRPTESSNSNITLATPKTGMRRSSHREIRDSSSGQDYALNAAGINNHLSPPTLSPLSDGKITGSGCEKPEEPVLPPMVELPPSSSSFNLVGVSVFDIVAVYAFLRSFSTILFLSPFELDDFVTCIKSNDSTLLFDSIHVSLLRTLQKHLVSLSREGSKSASNCLRSLNWNLLDSITWPVFVVEYLLLHNPGYIPGLNCSEFQPFQNDYYEMPVSAKVEILRHLCDDLIEVEALTSEVNRRVLETDANTKCGSSNRRNTAMAIASTSCTTEEDVDKATDCNGDECCLCKMNGNLICCDGCPAAYHSRCVGVISSLLPEGEWYCPECAINKDKQMEKPIRGAELLGIDPYGRLYYSSCGYLLVCKSCNDGCSSWFYKRNDLPTLIEVLESTPILHDKIISSIREHWNVIHGFDGMRSDVVSRSYYMQSAFYEKRLLSGTHLTPSEALNKDEGFAGKKSDEKSTMTTDSSNIGTGNSGHVNLTLEAQKDGERMENQLASSEGSAEVSQALTKKDTLREGGLDCSKRCSQISDDSHIPKNLVNAGDQCTATLQVEEGKNLSSANYGYALTTLNSRAITSQVPRGTHYVNFYEFARTASLVFEELESKSSHKTSEDVTRSVRKNVSRQLKLIMNRFAEFSWSNIPNSNMKQMKEKCGWCIYCQVPEDGMDCLFIMNDSFPAVENFTSEILDIGPRMNRKNHLIDVIFHIICIEDHLQGLLLGPWLDPNYSQLWRKSVLGAANLDSIKSLLLKLESNLYHLAISADWRKCVDSVATMGSACHIVRSSKRVSPKHEIGSRKAKSSKPEMIPPSKAGLSLLWWRGGKTSRELFNWKVLPRSLASKAARQGGCKKIKGIQYPDSGEIAKRTKYTAWRAAVETSRTVEQLSLQVRDLNANIRWDAIGNTHVPAKREKESKKSIKSFNKAIIHKKYYEGKVVKYLLDFGKKRFIPHIIVKHGSMLEESSSGKKKYWLEESHVPLHLVKAFEEKRISRNPSKIISGELHDSSSVIVKPFQEKGFSYLFSRAERSENYQCGHCKEDVSIREAVSCQYCKGFFHESHAQESAGSSTAELTYSCHRCQDEKFVQVDARKDKTELPKWKKASEALKSLCSRKRKKLEKEEQPEHSKKIRRAPLVVPVRSSVRNAQRLSKLASQKTKKKKIIKCKQDKPKEDHLEILKNCIWQNRRRNVESSYWLNGLNLSRMTNDIRLIMFRIKMLLVLSGEATPMRDKPKCSLCNEMEYTSKLNYVACEKCGAWFHGDALDLTADKIRNIIGFNCHNCRKRRPLICPHQCPTGSNKDGLVSVDNAENQSNAENTVNMTD